MMAREGSRRTALIGAVAAGVLALAAPGRAQSAATVAGGGASPIRLTLDPPSDPQPGGLSFHLLYVGETLRGVHLVPPDTVGYRGNVNLHLGLDTDRAGWWEGGTLFLDLQHGHGRSFALVLDGVTQFLSDIDSADFTQVYQWGVDQSFAGGRLRLRLGKQDVNDIFAVNNLAAEFLSPPFTLIPTVPMPTFPAPAFGAALFVDPDRPLSVGMGFFDGGATIGGLGLDSFFDGAGGYFTILEPTVAVHLGKGRALSGTWRLGLWYHGGLFPATDREGSALRGNGGAFLLVDQMLSPPAEDGRQRGPGVFLQAGWAPADRNPVSQYLSAGLKYVGIVPGREADYLSVGLNRSRWNLFHPPGDHEDVYTLEVFYVARLSSWASLQPDLQVFSPGSRDAGYAGAYGLRWLIHLR